MFNLNSARLLLSQKYDTEQPTVEQHNGYTLQNTTLRDAQIPYVMNNLTINVLLRSWIFNSDVHHVDSKANVLH